MLSSVVFHKVSPFVIWQNSIFTVWFLHFYLESFPAVCGKDMKWSAVIEIPRGVNTTAGVAIHCMLLWFEPLRAEGQQHQQAAKPTAEFNFLHSEHTCIPLSVSLLHPSRIRCLVCFSLTGASFCKIVADVVMFNPNVDKFTSLHNLGSDATSLHRRQTLDILKQKACSAWYARHF